MSVKIAFINEKGGIGKSSSCFNTAWALSEKKKILMIDIDGQRANLTFFCGIKKTDDMDTIFNVLQTGTDIKDVIVPVKKNLDLIPANVNVSDLNQSAKITKLKHAIEEVSDKYDYIFIDVNPTPNWSHVLALSVSDFAVIPMLPDIASLEANKGIAESIEEIQNTTNSNLKVLGLLFNKNTNRTNLSHEVNDIAEKMAKSLNSKVFQTKIRVAVALSENINEHVGITEYAPSSPAAKDFRDFVKELEKEVKKHV